MHVVAFIRRDKAVVAGLAQECRPTVLGLSCFYSGSVVVFSIFSLV